MAQPVPIECSGACTVTVQIEPAPPSPENLTDLGAAWGLMLLALLMIWGAKQLYNVFNGGPHDGS